MVKILAYFIHLQMSWLFISRFYIIFTSCGVCNSDLKIEQKPRKTRIELL